MGCQCCFGGNETSLNRLTNAKENSSILTSWVTKLCCMGKITSKTKIIQVSLHGTTIEWEKLSFNIIGKYWNKRS